MVTNRWGGTHTGCNCLGRTGTKLTAAQKNSVFSSACNTNMTQSGCITVAAKAAIDLKKWNGKYICGKKSPYSYTQIGRASNATGNPCPASHPVACGSTTNFEYKYCYVTGSVCPINSFKVQSTMPTGYSLAGAITGNNIYYSKTFAGNAIQKSETSRGTPCISESQTNGPSRTSYVLDNVKSSSCSTKIAGTTVDDRYLNLNTVSETTFYTENNIMTQYSGMPAYNSAMHNNVNYHWYSRGFLHWKAECEWKQKITRADLLKQIDKIQASVGFLLGVMIVTILHILCVNVCLTGLWLCKVRPWQANKDFRTKVGKGKKCFNIFFNIIMIILLSIFRSTINKTASAVKFIKSTKCSDTISNTSFNSVGTDMQAAFDANLGAVIMTSITLFMDTLFITIGLIKGCLCPKKKKAPEPEGPAPDGQETSQAPM